MALTLQTNEVYIGLAIIGIFSGLGTAIGQYIFNEIIKPTLHKKINKVITTVKETRNSDELIQKVLK